MYAYLCIAVRKDTQSSPVACLVAFWLQDNYAVMKTGGARYYTREERVRSRLSEKNSKDKTETEHDN